AGISWVTAGRTSPSSGISLLLPAILIGGSLGLMLAQRVQMTGMPELVAVLHSFVAMAAVLVGISSYLSHRPLQPVEMLGGAEKASQLVSLLEIWVGVAVGSLTFTGSVIAWAKLRGPLSGRPLLLPGRHA